MKIGVSRSSSKEEAREVLEAARRFGFEGVQLKPSQYEGYPTPAAFESGYGALAGLACGGLIAYPGKEAAEWPAKVENLLPFASGINAGHLCLCSNVYQTGASDEQVRHMADVLTQIGRQAAKSGMVISIHNHVGSLVETEEDVARLLALLDPTVCGLTLDTAHAAKGGIADVASLVRRFHRHLINVHLKDIATDGSFCALGQGTLRIEPILSALTEIDYRQWLIVDEETKSMKTEEAFAIATECLRKLGVS